MSAPTDDLDALAVVLDNAKAVGRDRVVLHVRRTSQPKGRTRLAGRSGPLSIGETHFVRGDIYAAWWRVVDVRAWVASQRVSS